METAKRMTSDKMVEQIVVSETYTIYLYAVFIRFYK